MTTAYADDQLLQQVSEHVEMLKTHGITQRKIALLIGVSTSSFTKYLRLQSPMPVSRAEQILSVTPEKAAGALFRIRKRPGDTGWIVVNQITKQTRVSPTYQDAVALTCEKPATTLDCIRDDFEHFKRFGMSDQQVIERLALRTGFSTAQLQLSLNKWKKEIDYAQAH